MDLGKLFALPKPCRRSPAWPEQGTGGINRASVGSRPGGARPF